MHRCQSGYGIFYSLNYHCIFEGAEDFVDEQIALMLPINSPYLKLFDKELYRLLQMGFIQKWIGEYLPKKDKCWSIGKSQDIENHTVNLTDMQGCFLVLIAGKLCEMKLENICYVQTIFRNICCDRYYLFGVSVSKIW